jgi:hypothetical protein
MVGSLNTTVKNESTGIVIFPFHSNQYRELHKFLSSYLGYTDKNLLKYMLTTLGKKYFKTRYVYIARKNPNILIHRNGVEIIPDEYGFENITYANIPLIP